MDSSIHPNPIEKKTVLREENAILSLNPDSLSQARSSNEIWKEFETVLARLRFFENYCVWWNTDGLAGTDEQAFLTLTIDHLAKIIKLKGQGLQFPIDQFSVGHSLENEEGQSQ